jgi:hypothetical protein
MIFHNVALWVMFNPDNFMVMCIICGTQRSLLINLEQHVLLLLHMNNQTYHVNKTSQPQEVTEKIQAENL